MFRITAAAVMLILFTGCWERHASPLHYMYQSKAMYDCGSGKELTLITDEHNEVHIISQNPVSLRVIGEDGETLQFLIRYASAGSTMTIIGSDPRKEYASFAFQGTAEELFGYHPEERISADIILKKMCSENPYTNDHIRLCHE